MFKMKLVYRQMLIFLMLLVVDLSKGSPVVQTLSTNDKVRYLTIMPQNIAGLVGQTVILSCEVHEAPPKSRVMWIEYTLTEQGLILSDNHFIVQTHPNSARYRVIQNTPTQFNLEIKNVTLTDAGKYSCQDINAQKPDQRIGHAELIVMESETNCTSTVRTTGLVLEDDTHYIECKVTYRGAYAPTLTWSGPQPFGVRQATSPTSVISRNTFTVHRSMNLQHYECKTHFIDLGDAPAQDSATNIPDYTHVYKGTDLMVYWGPKNQYVEPIQRSYKVGDTLHCYADAKPAPYYDWQNQRNWMYYNGQNFTVPADMAGTNQSMRCQSQNLIDGFLYTTSIYIPVSVEGEVKP